jgi:hypothetical protein
MSSLRASRAASLPDDYIREAVSYLIGGELRNPPALMEYHAQIILSSPCVGSQVKCPGYVAGRMSSRDGVPPRGGARAERMAAGHGWLSLVRARPASQLRTPAGRRPRTALQSRSGRSPPQPGSSPPQANFTPAPFSSARAWRAKQASSTFFPAVSSCRPNSTATSSNSSSDSTPATWSM